MSQTLEQIIKASSNNILDIQNCTISRQDLEIFKRAIKETSHLIIGNNVIFTDIKAADVIEVLKNATHHIQKITWDTKDQGVQVQLMIFKVLKGLEAVSFTKYEFVSTEEFLEKSAPAADMDVDASGMDLDSGSENA